MGLKGALAEIAKGVGEVLLPPVCTVCEEREPDPLLVICGECQKSVKTISGAHCPVCKLPFHGAGDSHPCAKCRENPPAFDATAAYAEFNGPVRELILKLKYSKDLRVRKALYGMFLAGYRESFAHSPPPDLIIPIPCHVDTLRERGFDLAALLALEAGRELGAKVSFDVIQRRKTTQKMAELTLKEREKAIKDVYHATGAVKGRVLLVDDVVTTTQTVRAVSKLLIKAGADEVIVAAIARTPLGG